MTAMTGVRLRHDEAGPLLHALVARVGADAGVPTLSIKGPVVAMQGLRAPRDSADADVLLHPADLATFVEAMSGLGWRQSVALTTPAIAPRHAVNLLNDHWPMGIDVHHFFPGFLADPSVVFDALWERHEVVRLAGAPVPAVDTVGQLAVVALHLLREDPDGVGAGVLDLTERASRVLSASDLDDLVALARTTDSTATLRPVLVRLGVPEQRVAPARDEAEYAVWQLRTRSTGSAPWLVQLSRTPRRQWPRAVWHALMLTDAEIYAMHLVSPGEASLASLRWRRIRRGVRGMPRSIRSFAGARQAGRPR